MSEELNVSFGKSGAIEPAVQFDWNAVREHNNIRVARVLDFASGDPDRPTDKRARVPQVGRFALGFRPRSVDDHDAIYQLTDDGSKRGGRTDLACTDDS
ncbi:MAG: hypothetical protein Aurels2KO_39800 [Aureliella sp.]